MNISKMCSRCKLEKTLEKFYFQNSKRSKCKVISSHCKSCVKAARKKYSSLKKKNVRITQLNRGKKFHIFIRKYFVLHPCLDCGNNDPRVLQFDHVRGKKLHAISTMKTYSLAKIEKEISKCEVRCANCHSIKTSKEQKWYKDIDFTQVNLSGRGEMHHSSKLTKDNIHYIRSSLLSSLLLSKQFKVSYNTIRRIRKRELWKTIP